MGTLNLQEEPYYRNGIKRALKKRGMRMDMEDDWEIRGPHQDMNYVVFVGYAYFDKLHPFLHIPEKYRRDGMWVAIYPRAVYEIEDELKWYMTDPEQRVFISEN